jgi:N-acetylmuramoyl-L-alanine amidase
MKKLIVLFAIVVSPLLYAEETSHAVSEKHVECLAKNLYFEARGEPRLGQIAVAHVVLNRTQSEEYPSDICKVIYEPHQFTWTKNARAKIRDWELFQELKELARHVIMNRTKDPTKGALNFHRVTSTKTKTRRATIIGNHIFYTA